MEMYGMETKVNDVKTQETTNNQQTPPTNNEKDDVVTLTLDDLKKDLKRYKFIKTKMSKLGELVIEVDGTILFYVAKRQYGLAFQINNVDHWVTKRITNKEQLENKVDAMKKLHNANEQVSQARRDIVG